MEDHAVPQVYLNGKRSLPENRYAASFKRSLEAVKRSVPLERYAGSLTELQSFGRAWFTGRCPLPAHEDRTPSFYIYPGDTGGRWWCYGCSQGGDVLDLFMGVESIPENEKWVAMIALAERFDVALPKRPDSWFRRQKRHARWRDALTETKVHAAQRRLYRRCFEPLVLASTDEEDREHDAKLYWQVAGEIAQHLVASMMSESRQ